MLVEGLTGNPIFPQFSPIQGWNVGEEAWKKASMRFLFVFPSEMGVRSVSASHVTLYNILKETYGDDIFIDIWMEPLKYLRNSYEKSVPNYIVGFFSHHSWQDFDIIGFSLAITMSEHVETPVVMHRAGIPIWTKDRLGDKKYPLICAGGISIDNGTVLNNIIDIFMLGLGERNLPLMVKEAYEVQAKFGSVAAGKEELVSRLQMHRGFYNPRLYHYDHRVESGHFVSDYLSCDVPGLETVIPDVSLPAEMIKLGDNQLRLSVPGGQHKVSLQSSYGAVVGETMVRTPKGLVAIKSVKDKSVYANGKFEKCQDIICVGEKPIYRITFSDGSSIDVSEDHKFVVNREESNQVIAKELKIGTSVWKNLSLIKEGKSTISKEYAELLGFFFGDGGSYYDGRIRKLDGKPYGWGLQWTVKDDGYEYNTYVKQLQALLGRYSQRVRKQEFSDGNKIIDLCVQNHTNNDVNRIVEKYNLFGGVYDKEFPTEIYEQDYETRLLFLKGYLQADGSIIKDKDNDRWQISWFTSSSNLFKGVVLLANSLGLQTFRTVVKQHVDKRGVNYSEGYQGSFTQSSTLKFLDLLDTISNRTGKFNVDITENNRRKGNQYKKYKVENEYWELKVLSVENLNCKKLCWDIVDTESHLADYSLIVTHQCHGSKGTCSFCHEGHLYGAWRERSQEDYRAGIVKAKKSSMGEGFGWFSFNGNFLENYVQSLQDAAEYFNKIGSINIRIDSLAGSIKLGGENNYIRLLKELGASSIACPIEGISQRMRNYLNKNLTEDDILTVDAEVFKRRMIRLKHGLIWTGEETKEDYEEHEELYRKIIELRDSVGANTQLQANCTWLVYNYGCPLYYAPRKTTAFAWKQFFSKLDNKDFYFYPWMYLSDLGVKLKESSQPKDTIIQQNLQDCPPNFLEEIWIKPIIAGKFENLSTEMVQALRKGFEEWGVNPRDQFLNYNPKKNPRQHLKIGFMDKVYEKECDGDPMIYLERIKDSSFSAHGCCLKTPATLVKHNESKCVGCDSCKLINEERKLAGLPPEQGGHINFMHNRPLRTDYNLMDIKTALMVNSPSFYYQAVFKIGESCRYISKEGIIRRWLSKATDFDENLIKNFRTIAYAFHKALDYEGLLSTYTGYELCKFGFKNALDLDKFKDDIAKTNEAVKDSGIQLVQFSPAQESGGNNYKVLASVDIDDDAENVQKFISHFKEEHRLYEGSTSMPETFAMPFDYKVMRGKTCYRIVYLMKPRWNLVWSDGLKKWTANKVLQKMKNYTIHAIYNQVSDGRLIDVFTGNVFVPQGFIHINQTGNEYKEKEEEGLEIDGA